MPSTGWDYRATTYGSESYALLHSLYTISVSEGATLDIYSTSYFDPYVVIIYDAYGNAITANSESDDPADAWLSDAYYSRDVIWSWKAPYTGLYYVDASWHQGSYYTFYSLSVYMDTDTVVHPNRAPVVSYPEADSNWTEGVAMYFEIPAGTFSDPDGNPLTISAKLANGDPLPSWLTFSPSTSRFQGTAPAGSPDYTVRITATDPSGLTATDEVVFYTLKANAVPTILSSIPDTSVTEGTKFTFQIPSATFYDPDGDSLAFSATLSNGSPLPTWLTFDPALRTLTGQVPAGAPDLIIRISARDPSGGLGYDDFVVSTIQANSAPIIKIPVPSSQIWPELQYSTYTLPIATFADPEGGSVSISVRGIGGTPLPSWLKFDPANRTISGIPSLDSADLALEFVASDSAGLTVSTPMMLVTKNLSRSPSDDADYLIGSDANDSIDGKGANDFIDAGSGNDLIAGGGGSDIINGGPGIDTVSYSDTIGSYIISRDSRGLLWVANKIGELDSISNVESLRFGTDTFSAETFKYAPTVAIPLPADNIVGLVYRFYNTRDKAYFYTPSVAERDMIIRESTDSTFTPENGLWPYFYQGATFEAAHSDSSVTSVYRFYNTQTGHHFFTASEAEKSTIIKESTDSSYTPDNGVWPFVYEGVGFTAYSTPNHTDAVPVFRFYSSTLNRHFFTSDTNEAAEIRLTGLWTDEGVAFYGEWPGG